MRFTTKPKLLFATLVLLLSACSGGGGSGGGSGGVVPVMIPTPGTTPMPASPTPTATPIPTTVAGSAVELVSGSALSGFAVVIGSIPTNCLAAQSVSAMPCGSPVAPLYTTTTDAMGIFSLAIPAGGTYMLTIGKDSTYATLHRSVNVNVGPNAIGAVKIAALSIDEQKWLVDANNQRATVSVPTSYGNMLVDEYAEEQARQWAADVASGKTAFGDAGYSPYQSAYGSSPGSMYSAAGVLALGAAAGAYISADQSWMSEKANCPNGNWQTCTFAHNTGHYINLSNTNTVWVGLGESASSFAYPPYGNEYAYNLMLIENLIPQR